MPEMQSQSGVASSGNGASTPHDLFALTDEQILEIEPEAQDVELSSAEPQAPRPASLQVAPASLPAKPGPANPTIKGRTHVIPADAIDPGAKSENFALGGTWHVHPAGTRVGTEGNAQVEHGFAQPPSETDVKEAGIGMNLVVAAREKKVYFYDSSGVIGHPMNLKDFLRGC